LNSTPTSFSPDTFVARLRELRKGTGRTGADIAQQGGITKQTFSGYLHTGRLPSACVLANWVFRLGVNANWLLTGEGPMFRDQARPEEDPLVQRVAQVVGSLRQAKAGEDEVLRAVLVTLETDLKACPETAPSGLAPVLDESLDVFRK